MTNANVISRTMERGSQHQVSAHSEPSAQWAKQTRQTDRPDFPGVGNANNISLKNEIWEFPLWWSRLRIHLQWVGLLQRSGFDPWPQNFCMPQVWPPKKRKKGNFTFQFSPYFCFVVVVISSADWWCLIFILIVFIFIDSFLLLSEFYYICSGTMIIAYSMSIPNPQYGPPHPTGLIWKPQVFQSLWVSICSAKFTVSFF